jgi:hypothetical protein
MAPAGDAGEALQLLRSFQQVQQQRAEHYSALHAAFKEFTSGGQEGPYRRLLAELAPAFNSCSTQVRGRAGRVARRPALEAVQRWLRLGAGCRAAGDAGDCQRRWQPPPRSRAPEQALPPLPAPALNRARPPPAPWRRSSP